MKYNQTPVLSLSAKTVDHFFVGEMNNGKPYLA